MFECNYLWKTLHIRNDGSVTPCCYWEGDISPTSDILNSEEIVNARELALGNIQPASCNNCVSREKYGSDTRQRSLIEFSTPKDFKSKITPSDVEMIDFRVSNLCNFMCVMCGADNSHLIAKEQQREKPYITWEDSRFDEIASLLKQSNNLKKVMFAGGEPFYNIKQMNRILDLLIPYKDNIRIEIITNCSVVNDSLLYKLREFKSVIIRLSIDSLSNSNELQRWRANNTEILNNYNRMTEILDNPDNHIFIISPAISSIVVSDVATLFSVFEDDSRIHSINPNYVTWPSYLNISTLSLSYRKHIAHTLKTYDFKKVKNVNKFIDYLENTPATNAHYSTILKVFSNYEKTRKLILPETFYNSLEK